MDIISSRLRSLRKQNKLSQKQLAQMLGVSLRGIARYEHGDAEPNLKILVKVAEYFGVSLDYLAGRSDRKEILDYSWVKEPNYLSEYKDEVHTIIKAACKLLDDAINA